MKKKILSVLLMTTVVLSVAGCNEYDYITMEEIEEWQNNNYEYEYDYNYNDNTDYNQPSNNTETNIENSADTEEPKSDNAESGEAEYSENNLFKYGRALVQPEGELYGFIDKTGEIVIETKFSKASVFTKNGLAAVVYEDDNDEKHLGYIDVNGDYVIGPTTKWSSFGVFSDNNLACVCESETGLWGYINSDGEYVLEPQYSYAQTFSKEGLAMVTLNDKNIVIDETGACILELPENTAIFSYDLFSESGLLPAVCKGRYGYIDRTGKWVIEPIYMAARSFSKDGFAIVEKSVMKNDTWVWHWGIIDETGAFVVEPQYDHLTDFDEEGIAEYSFDRTGESGYIDYWGNPVMKLPEPSFIDGDLIHHIFDDGYITIGSYPHYRIKDKDGNLLNEPKVQYTNIGYEVSYSIIM